MTGGSGGGGMWAGLPWPFVAAPYSCWPGAAEGCGGGGKEAAEEEGGVSAIAAAYRGVVGNEQADAGLAERTELAVQRCRKGDGSRQRVKLELLQEKRQARSWRSRRAARQPRAAGAKMDGNG